MSEPVLLRSEHDGVLTLTLNRPDKLNALNEPLTEALIDALRGAGSDPSTRVVVLAGAGRGFSSGQDLEAFVRLKMSPTPISVADHLRRGYNVVATLLRDLEKPVVASLNGIAAGAGLSLALCCDLRIAADDTVMTLGFSKIGLIPDVGGSFLLPLLAGFGRGLELPGRADRTVAAKGLVWGLVNRLLPPGPLRMKPRPLPRASRT